MSQPRQKLCRCGRGKIMTGRHSVFNYKDAEGRQACVECALDDIKKHVRRSALIPYEEHNG